MEDPIKTIVVLASIGTVALLAYELGQRDSDAGVER